MRKGLLVTPCSAENRWKKIGNDSVGMNMKDKRVNEGRTGSYQVVPSTLVWKCMWSICRTCMQKFWQWCSVVMCPKLTQCSCSGLTGEGGDHHDAQRGNISSYGSNMERNGVQPDSHGSGLQRSRDTVVCYRGKHTHTLCHSCRFIDAVSPLLPLLYSVTSIFLLL